MIGKLCCLLPLLFAGVTLPAPQDPLSSGSAERVEKILRGNIMPFWKAKCLDRANGGYILNHDIKGEPRTAPVKMIVTQARMLWYFSRLARAGIDPRENLEAAELGFRFLRDRMWDARNGGFHWQVDETGLKRLMPHKHLYGQAFALYGLSEYYLASGRKDALGLATRLFDLLESRAHDTKNGGYREFFGEDWTAPPPGVNSYMGSGADPDVKLMNTHLHLLEAMTTYYRASKSQFARERLLELIAIETSSVVRKDLGACTDRY
jgi:cellobiose epimerase